MQSADGIQIDSIFGCLICAGLASIIIFGLIMDRVYVALRARRLEAEKEKFVQNVLNKGGLKLGQDARRYKPEITAPDEDCGPIAGRPGGE